MNLAEYLPFALTAIGSGGAGAGMRPILSYWKSRRAQADEVAMELVQKLGARIERLEEGAAIERELCDAKLSALRHELKNVQGNFDSLLLAIEIAPEKAVEVVAKIKGRRVNREQTERPDPQRQTGSREAAAV